MDHFDYIIVGAGSAGCVMADRLQPAFDACRGRELLPGEADRSDDEIDAFIRETAMTNFHASGTCRMGVDGMAVVDPEGRVCGIEGLRVADFSSAPAPDEALHVRRNLSGGFDEYGVPVSIEDHEFGVGKL